MTILPGNPATKDVDTMHHKDIASVKAALADATLGKTNLRDKSGIRGQPLASYPGSVNRGWDR